MADAPPRKPTRRKPAVRKPVARKLADGKPSAPTLRRLARAHTEAALQVLADVAVKGNSEASRISAAMALLDRGYGKSGTGQASDGAGRAPTLYQRIELVDGIERHSDIELQGPLTQNTETQVGDGQD